MWGYNISKPRVIDYDNIDTGLIAYVSQRCKSSRLCIGCGGCTATCSTANLVPSFNIRKIQMLMKRGERELLIKDLNKCMLCGKCTLVCPRGVDTRGMILSMIEYLNK